MNLKEKRCSPCEAGTPPLQGPALGERLAELHEDWELFDEDKKIRRDFRFADFKEAIVFINEVAELAESEQHHPDIHLENYKNIIIELWTHKITGLSDNDFILAAKIDEISKLHKQNVPNP